MDEKNNERSELESKRDVFRKNDDDVKVSTAFLTEIPALFSLSSLDLSRKES